MAPLIALIADPRHGLADDGTYQLSEEQAKAILELRLARLTALGRDEIGDELKKIAEEIKDYLAILSSRQRIIDIIKGELDGHQGPSSRRRGRPRSSISRARSRTRT